MKIWKKFTLKEIYSKLQKLEPSDLSRFANSKIFDWSKFDELII